MHLYQIDSEEYVIAANPRDALAVMSELGAVPHVGEDFVATLWPDDKPFTFCSDNDERSAVTKTAREWCAERGRGWFAMANG